MAGTSSGDFAELVGGRRSEVQGEFVVVGQVLVYEGEVGVDEVGDGEVFFDEVFGEERGFALHVGLKVFVVVRFEDVAGRGHVAEGTKIEPGFEEGGDELLREWVVEESFGLLAENFWFGERAVVSEGAKFLVRGCGPKEVGKAGGEVVGRELVFLCRSGFGEIEK